MSFSQREGWKFLLNIISVIKTLRMFIMSLEISLLVKEFGIKLSITVSPLFFMKVTLSWLKMIYKNYKSNSKLFNHPMQKIGLIMRNIWTHMGQVLFRKIQQNSFFVIEKATLIFQNFQDYLINTLYLNVTQQVEKWIPWIPQLMINSN